MHAIAQLESILTPALAQTVTQSGNVAGGAAALAIPCGLGLVALALFIWALIDAIQNPRLTGNLRLIWILVIVFTSPIGAILYLLIGRKG